MKTGPYFFFTGSGNRAGEGQVDCFAFHPVNGGLEHVRTVARTPNPSYFWKHPLLPVLVAVNELEEGSVAFFSVGQDGSLEDCGRYSTLGSVPCHLDGNAEFLAVANYRGPGLTVFSLGPDGLPSGQPQTVPHTGSGPHPIRQTTPHPHGAHFDQKRNRIFVPDLGTDEVLGYMLEPKTGEPVVAARIPCPPGSGPRHAAFHPHHPILYVLTELSNELLALESSESGAMRMLSASSSLPSDFQGTSHGAEIAVHPSGKLLFVSNRGSDTLGIFELSEDGLPGNPSFVPSGGGSPRHFSICPDGNWLLSCNQSPGNIQCFAISNTRPFLVPVGSEEGVATPSPMASIFLDPEGLPVGH